MLALVFVSCLTGFSTQTLFAQAPAPVVRFDQTVTPPDVPLQVVIGEDLTFRVRFRNTPSSNAIKGYGPFIDLILDAGGANLAKQQSCLCDGMTFVTATMVGLNTATALVSHVRQAPCTPSPSTVSLVHPFAAEGVSPVQVPAGSQLVTLELPFGSFDPNQPEVIVEVTAHLSQLEDANDVMKIYARGGFRFGATAAIDPSTDPPVVSDAVGDSTQWVAEEQTTATVILVGKKYLGPEDETVSGPNFRRRYQITVDIAAGQTVSNVTVTDRLPNNMAYHAMDPLTSTCFLTPFQAPVPGQANNGAANWLVLKCASLTGVVGPDAFIVFEFFVPEFDGNNNPILANACDVASVNDVIVEALWTPIDACDIGPVNVVSDATPNDYTITARCLAIQKTVAVLSGPPPAHPIPGDTLEYTLSFQLSDFKTADNLRVQDFLSDGHTMLPATLMLSVTDQCGTTSGPIPTSAWSQTAMACGAGAPPPRTELNINVSAAMTSLAASGGPWRHQNGILTGGSALSLPSGVPALGTITFQATIADTFQCPVASPHDLFVDKDDLLLNSVTLTAGFLANSGACTPPDIPSATGTVAEDDSNSKLAITSGVLTKTTHAVRRGGQEACGPNTSPCPLKPDVFPGDQVTFRVRKTIPSGDAENLVIHDWLPLPTFVVTGGTFSNAPCGLPAPGNGCLGPAHTLSVAPAPTFTTDIPSNSIRFDYGTFNDPANQSQAIDLLLTFVVTTTPFIDGLYVTNEAGECESNSFGEMFCQAAIAEVRVREPALRIRKGVVAANNPNAVFSPPQGGSVTFNPPGTSCRRFNGTINSATLASINSNISRVDAGDCITFAVVVENTGGSAAYDVKLQDLFPLNSSGNAECFTPDFATLCVTDGTGTPLPFTAGTPVNGNVSITLQNPVPAPGTSGSNIVVITFDACVINEIKPGCCDNTAKVESYAATAGGPNFASAGFGGPLVDTGQLCILPGATKLVRTTSEEHTPGTPNSLPFTPEQLAIGEIIRYQIQVVVPESTSPSSYKIQEFLPAGLSYLAGSTTTSTMSSGVTADNPSPLVTGGPFTCSSGSPLFDFGNVINTNLSAVQETIVLEFNALVCNTAPNQNGATRDNAFGVLVNGQQMATSNSVQGVIVEPNIKIIKTATAPSRTVGATATYTITLASNGSATAFDVRLADTLPACLTSLSNIQITTAGGVTGVTNNSAGPALNLSIDRMPVNGTVTVVYSATLSCVDCSQLVNTARVTWTSLPGVSGTTTNPTNSPTPGASGLVNGERDGSGLINDYSAVATSDLCCLQVTNPTTSCNPDRTFTYTFTVTNVSNATISGVTLSPISPASTTITPASITFPPLAVGASTTVTVTIGGPGVVAGADICFSIELTGQAGAVCKIEHCVTAPSCCVEPPAQMVAWYPLDEARGALVEDVAPAPGSSFNNVGTPQAGGPFAVAGKVNGALCFCGPVIESVTVPTHSDLDFGGGGFSIDAWVRPAHCGTTLTSLVDKLDQNAGFSFYLAPAGATTVALKLQINGSTFTSTSLVSANANPFQNIGPWSHIAVTVNAAGVGAFYIDGAVAGTFTAPTGPLNNSVPMWIGRNRIGGTPYQGQCEVAIDELEIFSRALTQQEVQSISGAGSWGKCRDGGTLCVTKFEDVNGNGARNTGEPLLPGWAFNVTDSNGTPAGTITTGQSGAPGCLQVPAGDYTVNEQLQSGWTVTTPNPQTVTVFAGQIPNLFFGNTRPAAPKAVKSIVTTSEVHTPGTPSGAPQSPERLAIGEIIRYRLAIDVLPSNTPKGYILQDFLPPGLSYLPGTATITSLPSGVTVTNSPPQVTGSSCPGGGSLFINLGNVTNGNTGVAVLVVELNALVCNVTAVQSGTTLDNRFDLLVDAQVVALSNTVAAVAVEPNITIAKAVTVPSVAAGAAATYTITLANNGTANAFDVRLTDALPGCLTTLGNVLISTAGGVTGVINTSTSSILNVAIASIPVNGTVTVTYTATLTCTDCVQLVNNARVAWTSLPGPLGTTTNPTSSMTPGTSGLSNGERGDGGGVNDYAAVASASLCCMQVSRETITCSKPGTFTYAVSVTNLSNSAVSTVAISPISPSGMTITPNSISIPPLAPGASTTVTVTLTGAGAVSGAAVCLRVAFVGQNGVASCASDKCITLPACCAVPPPEMVAWYPLDEPLGAPVNDVAPAPGSGFNNVGQPTPGGASGSPAPVTGKVSGAQYFRGPYVEVPNQSDLAFSGDSIISIDAWVRVVRCEERTMSPIVDKFDRERGFVFYLEQSISGSATLKLRVNQSTFTGGSITANSDPLSNTGQWFHVAVVFKDQSGGAFFIDGQPAGTFSPSTGSFSNDVPMWIGTSRLDGRGCPLAIDELEIFNRAIDQTEIQAIFNAGSAGKCRPGSICVTKFEDLNANGVQNPGEAFLAGWLFGVADQNNSVAGTITTAGPGTARQCLTIPAGTYTVTEQILAGWVATTPNPQTVTVVPGQTTELTFGNKKGRGKRRATRP